MEKYTLITDQTQLLFGDKIRRNLGEGRFDYYIVGEYNPINDVYELNLPGKPRLIDAISVYLYMSKNNMIEFSCEVLLKY